jgi:hypothetical protein
MALNNTTQIFVKGPYKQTIVTQIGSDSTIDDLKKIVEDRTGVPSHLLYFVFSGKVLPNERTFRSLNITHDSTLICNTRAVGKPRFHIYVKRTGGKEAFEVFCLPNATVDELKDILFVRFVFLPKQQVLCYKSGNIEGENTLKSYGVYSWATIYLVERSWGSSRPDNLDKGDISKSQSPPIPPPLLPESVLKKTKRYLTRYLRFN